MVFFLSKVVYVTLTAAPAGAYLSLVKVSTSLHRASPTLCRARQETAEGSLHARARGGLPPGVTPLTLGYIII